MKPYCCHIACTADAEWQIEHGNRNACDAYTHACTAHVGAMLTIAGEPVGPVWFSVYPLDESAFAKQSGQPSPVPPAAAAPSGRVR